MDSSFLDSLENALIYKEGISSSSFSALEPKLVVNDYVRGKKVLNTLEKELSSCDSFSLSVAFITQGGLTPLLLVLDELRERKIKGRILTTNYFFMTDPKALKALSKLDNVDVRMFKVNPDGDGFHTKGYIFDRNNYLKVIIGSSNITQYALNTNKEWNLELSAERYSKLANQVVEEFDEMFAVATPLNDIYEEYRKLYQEHKKLIKNQKEVELEAIKLEPNYMQCKFISSLINLIEHGEKRALLISATGTGKTYASAFATKQLNVKRLLFVVHRAQIAKQAIKSFKKVFGSDKTYGLFTGDEKNSDCDFVFATVQTLSKREYLERFAPRAFDFIIIDEVHRAGAISYDNIFSYFKPNFILGMTATPDRMDGFDIYSLFDNNIAYEIRLKDALEYSLLCPFHYFALTELEIDGVVIDDDAIAKNAHLLVNSKRVEHIIEKAEYYGYCGERVQGLVFCSTVDEAKKFSDEFNERGYRTVALSGSDSQEKRAEYISRLSQVERNDEALDYIFTVDIFNEGVDIPSINQIIMLRPTESPIIFIQQLGRGLRKYNEKEFVVVLDFIGNYSNNYMISQAFSKSKKLGKNALRETVLDTVLPGASSVHFDRISKERILSSIDKARLNTKADLKKSYFNLKNKLNKIPTPMDIYNFGDRDISAFTSSKLKSYNLFVSDIDAEYKVAFSKKEQKYLDYISSYLLDGKRISDILLLKLLLNYTEVDISIFKEELLKYNRQFSEDEYESTLRLLALAFINSPTDKQYYQDISFIDFEDDKIRLNYEFANALENISFENEIKQLLYYAEALYLEKYSKCDDSGFVLYEKYTRKDVCRILNWEKDESATMYGYRIKYNTCPIFVTYNKDNDISKSTAYEDRFDSPSVFNWMTRNKVSLNSAEALQLSSAKENNLKVYLFIKKSDDEGIDFYYMGEVEPKYGKETTILNDKGEKLPIVNYKLMLKNEVKENLYEYLTGEK